MTVGAGHRDVVFMNFINEIAPITAGPGLRGEPRTFDSITELVEAPPQGLLFSEIREQQFGDELALVLDISVDPSLACSVADPCFHGFVSGGGDVWPIKANLATRAWFFESVDQPFAILTADNNDGWLDEATEFVDSLRFP